LTPVLFNPVDIGDEIEIERVVGQAVRPVLSTPVFAEDRRPAELDGLWHSFTRDLIAYGIVSTVLFTLRLASAAGSCC
jgi:hypothetical protein